MGVDWYPCEDCGRTFPDCGPCGHCSCERFFCGSCQNKFNVKYGTWDADDDEDYDPNVHEDGLLKKCDYCAFEKITAEDLLPFVLKKAGLTRKQAETQFREKNQPKKHKK